MFVKHPMSENTCMGDQPVSPNCIIWKW